MAGRLEAGNLHELLALLAGKAAGQGIVLDLKDLTLVDRGAVRFLRECQARGIRLSNCPGYIGVWIASGEGEES